MSSKQHCPKCGEDISDSHEEDDPSVGIIGGWYCEKCDLAIETDPFDGDET